MKYKVNQHLVAINDVIFNNSNIKFKKGFGYRILELDKNSVVLKVEEYYVVLDKKDVNESFVIYKGCHK